MTSNTSRNWAACDIPSGGVNHHSGRSSTRPLVVAVRGLTNALELSSTRLQRAMKVRARMQVQSQCGPTLKTVGALRAEKDLV